MSSDIIVTSDRRLHIDTGKSLSISGLQNGALGVGTKESPHFRRHTFDEDEAVSIAASFRDSPKSSPPDDYRDRSSTPSTAASDIFRGKRDVTPDTSVGPPSSTIATAIRSTQFVSAEYPAQPSTSRCAASRQDTSLYRSTPARAYYSEIDESFLPCPEPTPSEHSKRLSIDGYAASLRERDSRPLASHLAATGSAVHSDTHSIADIRNDIGSRASGSSLPQSLSSGIPEVLAPLNEPPADPRGTYLSPGEIYWSLDSSDFQHGGNVFIVPDGDGVSLKVQAHDNERQYSETPSVLTNSVMIPAYAFMPGRGEENPEYSIQIPMISLRLPTRDDAHELQQFLTEQKIHLSLRAEVALEKKRSLGRKVTGKEPKLVWKQYLVQLWTELGTPIPSREKWQGQGNAPPKFVSWLVLFDAKGDHSSFISIPLVHWDNQLLTKEDVPTRCITITRTGNANINCYTFTSTAEKRFPGIPLKKETFLECESQDKLQKYVAIHLRFGRKSARDDFRRFKECYKVRKKARGVESI